jgi:LacI family transcriptional regulator
VNDAARTLGYEPDIVAQSMRKGSTQTIGFLVSDISNPLFSEIALGVETTLNREGYAMLIANSQGNPNQDATRIRLLRQRRVDGFILSLSDEEGSAIAQLRELDRVGSSLCPFGPRSTGPGRARRRIGSRGRHTRRG